MNIRDDNLPLPAGTRAALRSPIDADLDVVIVTIWLLVLTLAITMKYGNALLG